MYKLLVILCLVLFLEHKLEAQSGRYNISRIDNKRSEGFVTINPYSIILEDSLTLPITDTVENDERTFFIIEGCYKNISFKGIVTLYVDHRAYQGIRKAVLYVEIRTAHNYSFVRYDLYYNES